MHYNVVRVQRQSQAKLKHLNSAEVSWLYRKIAASQYNLQKYNNNRKHDKAKKCNPFPLLDSSQLLLFSWRRFSWKRFTIVLFSAWENLLNCKMHLLLGYPNLIVQNIDSMFLTGWFLVYLIFIVCLSSQSIHFKAQIIHIRTTSMIL